ncbi:four helix bundle protein [Maribacter vaceletii]|uniref:Four helix bundle protein n=1 Tax=Maribacter vaceletii TaxID=1206816 RepID=A0A495E8E3_9FLAO|nr:four helix bundle protein [Maribacter vaceletii]RKR13204.1 four helix bundle protein [Maribacter vaceletii]
MRDYKKYTVWELGHEITLLIYKLTSSFPKEELYSLTSQMRRASYSIPSNIAEGCGRESNQEFKRYLTIARGSASELEYFLILVKDLNLIELNDFKNLSDSANKIKRSLNNLINKL